MYRRSRRRRRPFTMVLIVAVAAALVFGAWKLWPRGAQADAPPALNRESTLATGGEPALQRSGSGDAPGTASPVALTRDGDEGTEPGREASSPRPAGGQSRSPVAEPPAVEMGGAVHVDPDAGERTGTPSERGAPLERGSGTTPSTSAPTEEVKAPAALTDAGRRAFERAQAGLDLIARNEPVEGRRLLSHALASRDLSTRNAALVRDSLTELNERLVFSPEVTPDDPFTFHYVLQNGDALSRLPRRLGVQTEWRFLQRVNRIPDPKRIRAGQRVKIVTGPFHAVIDKSDYRLDLYLGDGAERVYVRSFPVGLGEFNSTPEGRFAVRPNSKLVNPEWVNPRTRERYLPDDPANPIGEHWIGLVGLDEHLSSVQGYGIHGTIEPESIGAQASMGCVRLLPEDVAVIWELLMADVSTIDIVP